MICKLFIVPYCTTTVVHDNSSNKSNKNNLKNMKTYFYVFLFTSNVMVNLYLTFNYF